MYTCISESGSIGNGCIKYLMAQAHERVFRSITQRFGNYPNKDAFKRILNDVNVQITYEDVSNRTKRAITLVGTFPYVDVR